MKKIISALILCSLIMVLLAGCNPKDNWIDYRLDGKQHWVVDEQGNAVDKKDHEIENGVCSVCGAEFTDYGDELWVERYNPKGDKVRFLKLDAAGNVLEDIRTEFTYDGDGNRTSVTLYRGERMVTKEVYTTIDNHTRKHTYCSEVTNYLENGEKEVTVLDQDGWPVYEGYFAADGSAVTVYTVQLQRDQYGRVISVRRLSEGVVAMEVLYAYNESNEITQESTYVSGRLTKEIFYATRDTSGINERYICRILEYAQDGSVKETLFD